MPITIPSLSSPSLSFKRHAFLAKVSSSSHPYVRIGDAIISNPSFPTKNQVCRPQCGWNHIGISGKIPRFSLGRHVGVSVNAMDNEGELSDGVSKASGVDFDQAEEEARAQSTMPERFRYLTKEAPDPPVRWPWFVG